MKTPFAPSSPRRRPPPLLPASFCLPIILPAFLWDACATAWDGSWDGSNIHYSSYLPALGRWDGCHTPRVPAATFFNNLRPCARTHTFCAPIHSEKRNIQMKTLLAVPVTLTHSSTVASAEADPSTVASAKADPSTVASAKVDRASRSTPHSTPGLTKILPNLTKSQQF
jgi:hypothetical protein